MSDDPTPGAPPPPPPLPVGTQPPPPPPPTAAPRAAAPLAPVPPKPAGPVIEYTMPEHKSHLPSPALIKNLGCLVKLVFGFTVLLGMGYFALVALNPKAREWATKGAKDGSGGPTPFKVVNQILAIPAQALGKTDDVVKANNARVGQLDNLVAEEETKTKGGKPGRAFAPVTDPFTKPDAGDAKKSGGDSGAAEKSDGPQSVSSSAILALAEKNAARSSPPPPPPVRPAVVAPAAPDTPDQMKLAGDIIIAHASPAGSPRASAAFFYWVVKLNVSGVTVSKPARVFINNRLAYEGDEVNRALGVTFARLDPANKLLFFRDAAGATVTRSY